MKQIKMKQIRVNLLVIDDLEPPTKTFSPELFDEYYKDMVSNPKIRCSAIMLESQPEDLIVFPSKLQD